MKKNLVFIALLLMATAMPFSAHAYDFSAVAPTGQTLYFNISGNNVTVTYPNDYYPYLGYTIPTGHLTIPSSVTNNGTTYSVTSIDGSAFFSCYLTSVTIPNSVTSIGDYAFNSCSNLTSVTIPNSVTSIGDYAFCYCDNLTTTKYTGTIAQWCAINFSSFCSNPTTLSHNLYINNSIITNLVIPNSVTSIGDYAFAYCSGLTSVTIPNSVTSIGLEAFAYCSGLTSVTIPDSVTSIVSGAFYECSGLTSVTIPNSVTSIGSYAFAYCSGLTSVTIPNSVTTIGQEAFSSCSGLTSVTIPNSVTTIGQEAFHSCSGLTSVTIPNSVTTIGQKAFLNCSGLTSIIVESGNNVFDSRNGCNAIIITSYNYLIAGCINTVIPNTVTLIGPAAFYGCSGLTSIVIPNSVTYIQDVAFYGCSSLTEITSHATSAPSLGNNVFSGVSSITVNIPCGSTSSYNSIWGYDFDFVEHDRVLIVMSSDTAMGNVNVLTQPDCQTHTAVFNAVPNTGYHFDHWSDGVTDNPRTIITTTDTTIVAFLLRIVI